MQKVTILPCEASAREMCISLFKANPVALEKSVCQQCSKQTEIPIAFTCIDIMEMDNLEKALNSIFL